MNGFVALISPARIRLLAMLAVAGVALAALPAAASAAYTPPPTQPQINTSIDSALGYFDANQNADGSWGASDPGAETALVLASYGVKGYANLTAAQQTRVQNGMKFLLGTQQPNGSFTGDGFVVTYDTATALIAMSLLGDVPTTTPDAIATAITKARDYLIKAQNAPPNESCQSTGPNGSGSGGQAYCGGWDYPISSPPDTRSDESNTGFALTGLELTGGVPAGVAAANVGWQNNVQELKATNPNFATQNDGGGSYMPGETYTPFVSNANDNGTETFGFGYDGVPATDSRVQAAIKIAQDTFDVYETTGARANRSMVYHTGMNEDGACDPATSGCDWTLDSAGEGGYHYSIFALVKGLSQFIAPDLTDSTNFYYKAADLLLSQQNTDGSWPANLRDDGSVLGATAFAVLALGRVGAPPDDAITATGTPVSATEGQSVTGAVATFKDPDPKATASEYSASINWGDGTTSTGSISGTGGNSGGFTVTGTHTYGEEGSFTVKVTITDTDNSANTATATTPAQVADAQLRSACVNASGVSFNGRVATFTDGDPAGTTSDYTVTINWGDGHTTSGSVSRSGSHFNANGSHTYLTTGTFHDTVTIKDKGGASTKVTCALTVTCPRPSGHLNQSHVGRLFLGETRRAARRALPKFVKHHNWDDFCLKPGVVFGERAAFGTVTGVSARSDANSSPIALTANLKGRIVILLTANRFYSFRGIRHGSSLGQAKRKLNLGRGIHLGLNWWYFSQNSDMVVKVRNNTVREIGPANSRFTHGHKAQLKFLKSFGPFELGLKDIP